jgi:glyoxylase-like metal-dependent hydrolase (beta-lactamase superfamily II)
LPREKWEWQIFIVYGVFYLKYINDMSDYQSAEAPFFIRTFPVGPLGCNCVIMGDKAAGQAIVVDPGGDADVILETLRAAGLTVIRIIHTHAHFDHFLAAGELHEEPGAPLCLHDADKPLWEHLKDQCALFGVPYKPIPAPHHRLSHEEELTAGSLTGAALWTPGHTPGSMSFWFKPVNLLIAGDTLFRRGVGRTDLWGGDAATLAHSIRERLYTLDDTTMVIPGHGPQTTIGEEMRQNPFVRA